MRISYNKLRGENVEYINCPKNKEKFTPGLPDTIVIHYTAGRDAQSSAEYLCRDNISASAHLVVGSRGIFQLVPFDTVAWHAGRSQYHGRVGLNNYSIGIEIDNPGLLTKTEMGYKTWFGAEVDPSKVVRATHRNESAEKYWHVYPEEQIQLVFEICELLVKEYNIQAIVGHEEISPGRKQDPGPAFPLDKLRDQVLFNDRNLEEDVVDNYLAEVAAERLNIREGPGLQFDTVTDPLPLGTELKIENEQDGWYKVNTTISGWVAKEYVVKADT